MTRTIVDHCYRIADNGVVIQMSDGSSFHVYGLGQNSVSVSYAPDSNSYPEMLDKGRIPENALFEPINK